MARRPRLDLPDIPHHVIQRGNNRQPCFYGRDDFERYLHMLHEAAVKEHCDVHAYVLMTNHVHLLVTSHDRGQLPRLMQAVGRNYVASMNRRHGRTGTLWEGRYKSCPVDTETYLFACYRYIELNPVRAGMVKRPADYPWSSYATNALGEHNPVITPNSSYVALARDDASRCEAYRMLFEDVLPARDIDAIRLHTQRHYALGSDRFRMMVETRSGVRAGPGKPGRPRGNKTVL